MTMTLEETIEEALREAQILEQARAEPNREHMLFTAMRLSGAPHSFVVEVAKRMSI